MEENKSDIHPSDIFLKALPSVLVAVIIGISSLLWLGLSSQYAKASKVSAQEKRIYKLEVAQVYTQKDLAEIKKDVKEIRNFLFNGNKPTQSD